MTQAIKKARMIGGGKKCIRCNGPKPAGSCGQGIALSRRGRAAICSKCGNEEGAYDYAKRVPGCDVPAHVIEAESRLNDLLVRSGGLKVPKPPRCSKLVKGDPFTGTRCSRDSVTDSGLCKRHLVERFVQLGTMGGNMLNSNVRDSWLEARAQLRKIGEVI